jgi:hypothetical protein
MIEDTGTVTKVKDGEYKYKHKGRGASSTLLTFATSPKQVPKPGDYIIQWSKQDVYCCDADTFKKKYSVEGMVIK